MPIEDAVVAQLRQTLEWLSTQREEDRTAIEQLTATVERLAKADNERVQMLTRIEQDLQHLRQELGPLPAVVSSVQQARELVESVSERVESLSSSFAQSQQVRAVEAERDRRSTADVAQQVSNLQRQLETQQTRLQALSEIVRRGQDEVLPLATRLDEIERASLSQASRLRQFDEQQRRVDNLIAASQQRVEALEREIAQPRQEQELTALRSSRQANEWQQQLDRVHADLEVIARPIRRVDQRLEQLGTVQKELVERLGQFELRVEVLAQSAARLESALNAGREQAALLASTIATHQQKIEEISAITWQTNERLALLTTGSEHVSHDLGRERVRIDEALSMIEEVEQRRHRLQEQLDGFVHLLREVQAEMAARIDDLRESLETVQQNFQTRVLEVERRQLAMRERQVSLLQAELREIMDVLAVWQGDADGASHRRRQDANEHFSAPGTGVGSG